MQKVTTDKRWTYCGRWYDPGTYVLENAGAAVCIAQSPGCRVETLEPPLFHPGEKPREILITRPGSFGDLLFLTPTIRALRRRFPEARIAVACAHHYAPILGDEITTLEYPLTEETYSKWQHHLWLENAIENNPKARDFHAVDLMAQMANVHPEDRHLDYRVSPKERREAMARFPRQMCHRVGIQVKASSLNRSYHPNLLSDAIKILWDHGHEILLLGTPGEVEWNLNVERITNVAAMGLTMRQSCAVLSTCDVVLAPDSALLHVAEAIGVPAVGLYGPFPSRLRVGPGVTVLEGKGACAPCHFHAVAGVHFPPGKPCERTHACVVLDSITPEEIVEAVEGQLTPY